MRRWRGKNGKNYENNDNNNKNKIIKVTVKTTNSNKEKLTENDIVSFSTISYSKILICNCTK